MVQKRLMAEPKTIAKKLEEVVPGLWHWSIHNELIDFRSDSYAVKTSKGSVLIDPLPLQEKLLKKLEPIAAIILTCSVHQRSAWRYRRKFKVPVYAPALSKEIDEEPDRRYAEGDKLPGNIRAVFTPGAGTTQHTLLLSGESKVAICPDLLVRNPDGTADSTHSTDSTGSLRASSGQAGSPQVEIIPEEYAYDIKLAKKSIKKLLELPFSILCLTHGGPIARSPKDSIQAALNQK